MDLKEKEYIDKIKKLAAEKKAVIFAHYYTRPEIQECADFIGDSLALAQQATRVDADILVMCGVHFMGETMKILCPEKKVLVPDMNAGCSLADSCKAEDLAAFKAQHPDHMVVSYVNTSAEVKALTDVVVTSSNAKKIVDQLPKDAKIIFGPDHYDSLERSMPCTQPFLVRGVIATQERESGCRSIGTPGVQGSYFGSERCNRFY